MPIVKKAIDHDVPAIVRIGSSVNVGKPINKIGFGSRPLRMPKGAIDKAVNNALAKPKIVKSTTMEVFDIPVELILDSAENPNEQDEATFDQLVQGIKDDGFDEAVIVVPIEDGPNKGKFKTVSGHHRKKAGVVAGMTAIPCIIKTEWSDDKRLIEIVRRNNLKGTLNPEKFVKLYNEVAKRGHDKSLLKLQMGFTKGDLFDKMFKQVEKNLTPIQKKKLMEAKERINSTESFSSVLNEIFTEHGTELDNGLLCFKYGDKNKKNIYYVECDVELDKRMKHFQKQCQDRGLYAADVFNAFLNNVDFSKFKKSDKVLTRKANREAKT